MKKYFRYILVGFVIVISGVFVFSVSRELFETKPFYLGGIQVSLDCDDNLIVTLRKDSINETSFSKFDMKTQQDRQLLKTTADNYLGDFQGDLDCQKNIYSIRNFGTQLTEVYLYTDNINQSEKIIEKPSITTAKLDPYNPDILYYVEARSFRKASPLGKATFHDNYFVKYNYKKRKIEYEKSIKAPVVMGFTILDKDHVLFTSSNIPNFFKLNLDTGEIMNINFKVENLPKLFSDGSSLGTERNFLTEFLFVTAEYSPRKNLVVALTTNRYLCVLDLDKSIVKVIREFDTEAAMNQVITVVPFKNEDKIMVLQESGLVSIVNYQGKLLQTMDLAQHYYKWNRRIDTNFFTDFIDFLHFS